MRGVQDPSYRTNEKDIGIREAFEWQAEVDAPIHAHWYRDPRETYWTGRHARSGDGISIEEQDDDPSSLLNWYRRLLELRARNPALSRGSLAIVDSVPELLVIEHALERERFRLVVNLSDRPAIHEGSGGPDLLGGTGRTLGPWQTALFELSADP